MKHTFKPLIEVVAKLPDTKVSVEEIHSEPMLFSADWNFAREHGGPLTNYVMDFLKNEPDICSAGIARMIRLAKSKGTKVEDFQGNELDVEGEIEYNCIIDTRSHMLMKGMYPAIPGWHCDGVPRCEQYSQPNLEKIDPGVKFYTCILSTVENVSQTEFLDEEIELTIDRENVWSSLDRQLNSQAAFYNKELQEGDIVKFDQNTPHRAVSCVNPGWRFFFRLGVIPQEPQNKIRKQVQVYTVQGNGW